MRPATIGLVICVVLLAVAVGVAIVFTGPLSIVLNATEAKYESERHIESVVSDWVSEHDMSFHVDIPVESSMGGSISELEDCGQAFLETLTPAEENLYQSFALLGGPFSMKWEEPPPVDRDSFESGDIHRQLHVRLSYGCASALDEQSLETLKEDFAEHLRSEANSALADHAVFDAILTKQDDGRIHVELALKDGSSWPGKVVFEGIRGRGFAGKKLVQVLRCRIVKNPVSSDNRKTQAFTFDSNIVIKDDTEFVVWIYGYPFRGHWIRSAKVSCQQ